MSQPWLEDLSEEWIPQPTPPSIRTKAEGAQTTQTTQSVPPKPQSRLPRLRNFSGSFSEIQDRHIARELRLPKPRSALAERSLSDNNVALSKPADASEQEPSRCASRSFSAASLDSVVHNGTVAQKPVVRSPTYAKPDHSTPAWRRRLLKGDIGYGDQKDLFSPMGLENIFQRPSDSSPKEQQPKRKLGMLKGLSAMPSSPPPWPSMDSHDDRAQAEAGDSYGSNHTSKKHTEDQEHRDSSFDNRDDDLFHADRLPATNQEALPRTVSGQIEFENENFSPVYLSTNLRVGSGHDPMPNFRTSELANRLRHLGSPPPVHAPETIPELNSLDPSGGNSSFARLQDDSLPGDLPAGTPDIAEVGRFVELKRGGYSRDGSFRRRPLSPSPQSKAATRSLLGNESIKASNGRADVGQLDDSIVLQKIPTPKTPRQREPLSQPSAGRTKSSGSPLKLFDAHDTFTSNRLHRRLSQLDHKSEQTASTSGRPTQAAVTKVTQKRSILTSVEETSAQKKAVTVSPEEEWNQLGTETFGQGQLNEYQFSGDFSTLSSSNSQGESAPEESPSIDVAPPGSRQPFKFQCDTSPISKEPSRAKRQGLTRVTNPFRRSSDARPSVRRQGPTTKQQDTRDVRYEYTEGKRGPTSPFKNPTPKRRRTLHSVHEDEEDSDFTGMRSVKESHIAVPSIIGRKRKDARHDQSRNMADPEVLARRHILRPRNPTPSQRRLDEMHAEILEATEAFIQSSPKMNTIREQINSLQELGAPSEETRAAIVANEVAAFSMKRQQAIRDETRKKSVTTQDFLDEAVKIMDYIRAKGRPTSGLGSLEESESELLEQPVKEGYLSSSLTFDRPPSREGCLSAWKEPNKRQLDPHVMNHLRKYQEKDSEGILGSSFHSLRFSRMRGPQSPETNSVVVEQDDIRITDNLDRPNKDMRPEDGVNNSQRITNGTQPSTGSSLAQTVATSTSRRSDHVATLAPEAVAHLIPKEVAGMSFDRENNVWVRQKSPSKELQREEGCSATNESEDDPFGNIPDLTVDESAERLINPGSPTRPQATAETFLEDTAEASSSEKVRPATREGKDIPLADTSSAPSKVSNFAWSFPKTETRATSWSDQATRTIRTQKEQHVPTAQAIQESEEDDIEHEIQYFEGRGSAEPVCTGRVRDITISIAERGFGEVDQQQHHAVEPQKHPRRLWSSRTPAKGSAWNLVRSAKTLPHGHNSRKTISGEEGDLSRLEDISSGNYRMRLSMSVSAPVLAQQDALVPAPSTPAKADVTFMLSDLPEFTLHQIDECELPDRVVIKHDGHKFSKALEDRYAFGTAELVKALQDVEPDEPYWEDLRQVNLHGKALSNLHRLDEFCYRLEELDVSNNSISQVNGVPFTMRRLQARNNCLTGLTSWTTLLNLQHLDISGNDIDSLDGLSELVHLRTLKADDNKVTSLEGLLHLDGLMELSVARNHIETVDFAKANLKSLTDIDLRGNRLTEVRNLHRLSQLQILNLDDNLIEEFSSPGASDGRCNKLRSLRLCRNGTTVMDINSFPRLESLYLDGNSLTDVPGLEQLHHLRTFSAREQVLNTDSDAETCVGNLLRNADVRNLYISLNPTRCLEISQHLLNLQRLELASMGLKELPNDFGQLTPNIRTLNLNFNSLGDLRPLLNIKRLNELLVAGNKLERLRANALVLGKLPTLAKLDWRDNPLTLRFYALASENRVMSLGQKPSDEQTTDRFVLPNGDSDDDQQYLLRLDYETRIRRRVTEMMLANFCRNLQELDGLRFDKSRILVKDDVWERLVYLGVIQRKQPDTAGEITE